MSTDVVQDAGNSRDENPTLAYVNGEGKEREGDMEPTGEGVKGKLVLSAQKRGQLKRRVTIGVNQIETLKKQKGSSEAVEALLKKLVGDFKAFSEYHEKLHGTLEGREAGTSEAYYREVESVYQRVSGETQQWLAEIAENGEDGEDSFLSELDSPVVPSPGPSESGTSASGRGGEESAQELTLKLLQDLSARMRAMEEKVEMVQADAARKRPEAREHAEEKGEPMSSTMLKRSAAELGSETGVAPGWSSPRRAHLRTRARPSFGGMSVIEEEVQPSEAESVKMLKSMAESFMKLADRKTDTKEEAIVSMAESFKAIAQRNLELSNNTSGSGATSYKLPKFNLFEFSGRAIDYVPFIRAYEAQVESRYEDPTIRLGALIQYTKGDLQELLKCCVVKDTPAEAYARAKEILTERYGRFEDLAQAWLDRFAGVEHVKTAEALLKLNSMLMNCRETLLSVKQLKEFETKSNLMVIINKLPRFMKVRWQERVVDLQETEGRSAALTDLIALTRRVYREKSDPIYGGALVEESPEKYQARHPRPGNRTFSIQGGGDFNGYEHETVNSFGTGENSGTGKSKQHIYGCICCGGHHTLYKCYTFKEMAPPERLKLVQAKGACVNCFHPKHQLEQCRSNYRCQVCKKAHHTMLHLDNNVVHVNMVNVPVSESADPQEIVTATVAKGKVALPVVPVKIWGPKGWVRAFALLDQGSTCSLVTDGLVDKLGCARKPHYTSMTTVVGTQVRVECSLVDLTLENVEDGGKHDLKGAMTRPTLNLSARCRAYKEEINRWPHLRHLNLPTASTDEIELLIGLSHPEFLATDPVIQSENGLGPFAAKSKLGWYVGGPMGMAEEPEPVAEVCNLVIAEEMSLEDRVDKLWRIEGIHCDPDGKQMSVADREVIQFWDKNVKHDGKKYSLPIPVKDRSEYIPNNRCDAERQLHGLERRFRKNPEEGKLYVKGMLENISAGYAEPIKPENRRGPHGKTRYLPHLPVYHSRKPGKPRIVFNAASKFRGKSLNDFIHSGPDLLNKLIDVLLKWRQDAVTINGDVEGMFNQIWVDEEDRDLLRFLFWKDGEIGGEIVEYRMKTHLFGGVWSPSCANYTLKRCADDFGAKYSLEAVKAVKERFYVDDGLNSTSGDDQAVQLYHEVDGILSKGGFNYTKLSSNSEEVLQRLPREKLVKTLDLVGLEFLEDVVECVLGNSWRPKIDRLVFVNNIPQKPRTRRGLLGTVSTIYDPLGLVGPIALRAKALFQESCRRKLGWDQTLPEDMQAAWDDWNESLKDLGSVQFRRCFLPEGLSLATEEIQFELHLFGDASTGAYGGAGYVRVLKGDAPVGCALAIAKGKLAPIRTPPVPRLELTAAQTAVQLDLICRRALDLEISRSVFWTDSSIVLWYLLNKEIRCMTFVANKVGFILQHTQAEQWHHMPTSMNPADIISRGATAGELADSSLWAHGPEFLLERESCWPKLIDTSSVDRSKLELKREVTLATCDEVDFDPPESDPGKLDAVLVSGRHVVSGEKVTPKMPVNMYRKDFEAWKKSLGGGYNPGRTQDPAKLYSEHFSSWYRLKRGIVYVSKLWRWKRGLKFEKRVTVDELDAAELGVCGYLQRQYVDSKVKRSKGFRKLFPYVTEGLIRVGGRLSRAELHPDRRNQIVLPDCVATRALIHNVHARLGHSAPGRVLAEILRKYWILQGRRVIGLLLNKCIKCRQLRAATLTPEMSDLHKYRVVGEDRPFYNTGVDYFGPILIKERRVEKKRYGCLFTCMQTRAIHVEVAWSLDLDSCINAVMRFAARRGMPRNIKSDNGTNLVGGSAELKRKIKEWNKHHVEETFRQEDCNWTFNTPAGSHMGGVWERQIRTVRTLMMSVCNFQLLTEESLLTVLCIIEDMVNNRPITPVNADARDLAALTPNHFLRMNTGIQLPVTVKDSKDAYRRRWLQVQFLCHLYWSRWRDEYLQTLQERMKWCRKERSLKVGDLVVVADEAAPRNTWPLARVLETYPDESGVVRSVKIVSRRGEFRRPVHKLALAEACS